VRVIQNLWIQYVGKMQSYWLLKHVVHIIATRVLSVKWDEAALQSSHSYIHIFISQFLKGRSVISIGKVQIRWNDDNKWKFTFPKKFGAAIQFRIFCLPFYYLKSLRLKHTKINFSPYLTTRERHRLRVFEQHIQMNASEVGVACSTHDRDENEHRIVV
jgi:hypothetical protein